MINVHWTDHVKHALRLTKPIFNTLNHKVGIVLDLELYGLELSLGTKMH